MRDELILEGNGHEIHHGFSDRTICAQKNALFYAPKADLRSMKVISGMHVRSTRWEQ
jgi:hypothetical protein